MRLLLLFAFLLAPAFSQDLGETEFANSGAPEAQEPFLRGLLLLHSFEYDDARDAFREARRIDPDFAMAAWGEAMTHDHPVWMRQDRDAARAALGDIADLGAEVGGVTERERAYLGTLDVLFGEGNKEDRDDRYAEAMRALAERYPDDLDARSFYALALLGTAHEGRDFRTYMEAAAVAEEVFAENRRHPGAAHYLIHAYDDPVHAPLGLRPARVYDQIAPAASHALHMPSHIYLALGMWEDVRDMNERSYDAAQAASDRRGEALNGHGWHALWWWHYAATQLDDRALANRLLARAQRLAEADADGGTAQAHVARIAAQHAIAFSDSAPLNDPIVDRAEGASSEAIVALARAVLALDAGQNDRATELSVALANRTGENAGWAASSASDQLHGRLLLVSGDLEGGLAALRRAADSETAAPLTFGPPSPIVPSNEALGYALLEAGEPEAAIDAFRASLARAPNRRQSVEGLAEARELVEAAAAGAQD